MSFTPGPDKRLLEAKDNEFINRSPDDYEGRLWYVISTHFFKLIWFSIICVFFSLPVITIPAALCGLYAVVTKLYRQGYDVDFLTFFNEFKRNFLKRMLLGIVLVVFPLFIWAVSYSISEAAGYVFGGFAVVFSLAVMGWYYPQLALLELKPGEALRNALILSGLEAKSTFLVLLIQVISMGIVVFLIPFSIFAMVFFIPGFTSLFVSHVTLPVIRDRIINKDKKESE